LQFSQMRRTLARTFMANLAKVRGLPQPWAGGKRVF
jgi:hypothetical protein